MLWVVTVAFGLFVLALAAPAARNVREASMTIRLISTVASFRQVDRPPKAVPNKGDVFYLRSVLRNAVAQLGRPKGAVVGSDSAVFTLLSAKKAQVNVRVKLPGGTLRVQGGVDITKQPVVLPVIGGTGRFVNARGTAEVRDRSNYSLNVYRLRLP